MVLYMELPKPSLPYNFLQLVFYYKQMVEVMVEPAFQVVFLPVVMVLGALRPEVMAELV
jgi:hypothetical protein